MLALGGVLPFIFVEWKNPIFRLRVERIPMPALKGIGL